MKTKFGIVGCGFLGNIVADAWKNGLLEDYELVVISIGAFADLAFYEEVKQAAKEGGAKVHLASGAIGGFDVLQTVTLIAEAQKLSEKAGIETHTGAKGFRNTSVSLIPSAEEKLHDYAKEVIFYRDIPAGDEEIVRRIGDADAVLVSYTSRIGKMSSSSARISVTSACAAACIRRRAQMLISPMHAPGIFRCWVSGITVTAAWSSTFCTN